MPERTIYDEIVHSTFERSPKQRFGGANRGLWPFGIMIEQPQRCSQTTRLLHEVNTNCGATCNKPPVDRISRTSAVMDIRRHESVDHNQWAAAQSGGRFAQTVIPSATCDDRIKGC